MSPCVPAKLNICLLICAGLISEQKPLLTNINICMLYTVSQTGDESERELFYDDILHVLQSTTDLRLNYGTDIGHTVFYYRPEATSNHHKSKAKLKR